MPAVSRIKAKCDRKRSSVLTATAMWNARVAIEQNDPDQLKAMLAQQPELRWSPSPKAARTTSSTSLCR